MTFSFSLKMNKEQDSTLFSLTPTDGTIYLQLILIKILYNYKIQSPQNRRMDTNKIEIHLKL